MSTLGSVADFALLAFAFCSDGLADSGDASGFIPTLIILLGALSLTIGVIAWPIKDPEKDGGEHGLV